VTKRRKRNRRKSYENICEYNAEEWSCVRDEGLYLPGEDLNYQRNWRMWLELLKTRGRSVNSDSLVLGRKRIIRKARWWHNSVKLVSFLPQNFQPPLCDIFISDNLKLRGTRWRSWLTHYATSRKVVVSIPDGVIGIFHWHNHSGRTMALGLTQPLKELSTRNVYWG
jgi:hypothetical protein